MVDALRRDPTMVNYEVVVAWFCDEGKGASDNDKLAASRSLQTAWEMLNEFRPLPLGELRRQSGAASSHDALVGQPKGGFSLKAGGAGRVGFEARMSRLRAKNVARRPRPPGSLVLAGLDAGARTVEAALVPDRAWDSMQPRVRRWRPRM